MQNDAMAAMTKIFEKLFSENISKNKRRRGRQPKFDAATYALFAPLGAKSHRGKQNYIYASLAMSVLSKDADRFACLLKPKTKSTILAELGRLGDATKIWWAATMICENKLKTGRAIAGLRLMRVGKKEASVSDLTRLIGQTIIRYGERHPSLTMEEIDRALRSVKIVMSPPAQPHPLQSSPASPA
jgi:hypothetical protein